MSASIPPLASTTMLHFSDVGMRYTDGTEALKSVSLSIPRGQFCVLLGSSGAGKSTLLRMANGLVQPTKGQIQFEGQTVERQNLAQIRPRIGMIHQQFNLVPRATVAANVLSGTLPALSLWRSLAGLYPTPLQDQACSLLEAVGLRPEHLLRRASELSGGQQQRVGIARAFMLAPPLVLADEPVASLDPQASHDVLELLREQAQQRGTTVLCSLHQVDLARTFADRIVALRGGTLVFDGPPSEFKAATAQALYRRSDVPSLLRQNVPQHTCFPYVPSLEAA